MFDFPKFMNARWKNPAELHAFMATYGHGQVYQVHYKWWTRQSIPAEWFAVVLALLEVENGRPVSLLEFMKS